MSHDSNAAITPVTATTHWWQRGVIYQIYPRSFRDANADGIGDLPGITEKLDYCAGLDIDAVWLSPIYPSPMADFGYDVADYTAVDPMFGTLDDFDTLIERTSQRGMKMILDFVPTTPRINIRGSPPHARVATIRSATGICGVIPPRTGDPPTTG